ncbi:MAG: M23 family metallopeptidase [Planctomycetes bacterium]|nr:M23 family metallopeptidase [Planctomycetota bacterium]
MDLRAPIAICAILAVAGAWRANDDGGTASRKRVHISKTSVSGTETVVIENELPCSVVATLKLTERENVDAAVKSTETIVVAPGATRDWITFAAADSKKKWKYQYEWKWVCGAPDASHAADYIYELPFEAGVARRVLQGYLGRVSHADSYAVDWAMPEGTTVCAARAGLICDVVDERDGAGFTEDYKQKNNFICLLHDDGTVGNYLHIKKDGALVKPGVRVNAGDPIAQSGNVGYSSTPHLHFSVTRPRDAYAVDSFPIRYRTTAGTVLVLEKDKYYEKPADAAKPR